MWGDRLDWIGLWLVGRLIDGSVSSLEMRCLSVLCCGVLCGVVRVWCVVLNNDME